MVLETLRGIELMRLLYTCPVCAYPEMTEPVYEGNICPCCGTEFGYDDDLSVTYRQLRQLWVDRGMPWFSRATVAPHGWDPFVQLIDGGLDFEFPAEAASDTTNSTEDMRIEMVA